MNNIILFLNSTHFQIILLAILLVAFFLYMKREYDRGVSKGRMQILEENLLRAEHAGGPNDDLAMLLRTYQRE